MSERISREEMMRRILASERDRFCTCPCHSSSFGGNAGSFHCMGGPCCSKPNVRKSRGCGY